MWNWLKIFGSNRKTSTRSASRHSAASANTTSAPKPITSLFLVEEGTDYRFMGPTHICVCGCDLFAVACTFGEYEIVGMFTDVKCLACGAILRAPTPLDLEV